MMNIRTREIVILAVGLALVLGAAVGGYAVVRTRADGAPDRQVLAPVAMPTPSASSGSPAPQYERWTVGKATGPVTVLMRPAAGARVLTRLGKVNQNGYPTLVLVDKRRDVAGASWTRVWVAMRPNETRGWVRDGQLAYYTTSSKVVIDLSRRKLMVYQRGALKATFPVAIGKPGLETPTGFYFINQKLRPPSPGGAYGVLAIGISAFQPKLAYWAQGGPVAIHGTNEDNLIGKAISHGCVRMHNADILKVNSLVPAGSPVIVQE
ncbi:MAG TPA: L,D-transpeptidase [Coriobacteriia bacterium]